MYIAAFIPSQISGLGTIYLFQIWPTAQLKYKEHFTLTSNTKDEKIAWGAFVSLTLLKVQQIDYAKSIEMTRK
jgi:hypothetical protein